MLSYKSLKQCYLYRLGVSPVWSLISGQVVNVLREACTAMYQQPPNYRAQLTTHISIPAAYKAGITLYVRQNTEVAQELFNAPELEFKD